MGSKAICITISCVCACPFNYFKITGKCDVFVNTVGRLEICMSLLGCQSVSRGLQSALSCTNFENSSNNIFGFWKIYTGNHTDCVFPIAVAIIKQWKQNFAKWQGSWWQPRNKTSHLVYLMANKHHHSIYHDDFAALVRATYNHKTFKTSKNGRFLQKFRFCSLNRQIKSHMMWDECLSVARSSSN